MKSGCNAWKGWYETDLFNHKLQSDILNDMVNVTGSRAKNSTELLVLHGTKFLRVLIFAIFAFFSHYSLTNVHAEERNSAKISFTETKRWNGKQNIQEYQKRLTGTQERN